MRGGAACRQQVLGRQQEQEAKPTWWKCAQNRMTVVVRPTSVDRPRIILLNTAWRGRGVEEGKRNGMVAQAGRQLDRSRWAGKAEGAQY